MLLAVPVFTTAQQPAYRLIPVQYELEHIKLNNKEDIGLFNGVTEDKEGYLWLTGTKGFHVYDGQNIITYGNGNKMHPLARSPQTNVFGYISKDSAGNFWIVDENRRFIQFDPARRMLLDSFSLDIHPDDRYFRLADNSERGLFFACRTGNQKMISLYRKTGSEKVQKVFETEFRPDINFYYQLVGNNHWFLQEGKLVRVSFDGSKVTRYLFPGGGSSSFIIYSDDRSIYFTGSRQDAVYTWNPVTDKLELFISIPPFIAGKIHAFYVENDKIYAGSNLNFFIINRSDHTVQDLSPQFAELARKEAPGSLSEAFGNIFRQKNGAIVLQTLSNLYRLKKKIPTDDQFRQMVKLETKRSVSDLVSFRGLAEDDHYSIYASYYTGISKKPAGKTEFTPLPVSRYLKGDLVSTYSLHYWKNNLLWNNVRVDMTTGKYNYMFDSIFSGHCTQFLQHDSLWLCKWGNGILHCYDLSRNILNSYPLPVEISSGSTDINDMIADASGQNLWIASRDFGLFLVSKKGELLKQYNHTALTISDDYITDLELSGNDLWFGSSDGLGVLHTATGKVSVYKDPFINNGLLKNRAIFSIQPDSAGNFYLGSSYGLLYFDTQHAVFYNLPEAHPLSRVEFNRGSALRTVHDRYYFGSTDGLFSFTPGELEFIQSSYAIKPVKLFGISIFNSHDNEYRYISEKLDGLAKLVLGPFDYNIQFSFSVPEFYRDIYYSYRIKGHGDNWSGYRPDNIIELNGLQPGDYLLELKVSTGLNDDNASYYSLPITMKQVWYKKPWVIALFSLLLVALLVVYLRSRFNQKLKRQKDLADLRTKISSDLHDDVGSILSGLAMQSQMLTYSAREEQKGSLNEISNMSREAMEHMRDTVWAMDSRKDKYENLIDRMRAFAEKNLALKNITHEFIVADIDTKKFIDPEKRQAIYLVFKEAITNIIKHSDGKHVMIKFGYEKNNLHLSIHDNGSQKVTGNSDGLGSSNMKMRAERINGQLTTGYENGFKVELIIQ